jgi:hypothetical protein
MDTFFGHFPHRMEVHAVDGNGDRMLVLQDDYLRRSPWVGETYAFVWDGTVPGSGLVRSGEYHLEMRVLRALGDPSVDEHWETWTSDTFEVVSPRRGAPPSAGGPPPGRGPGR